MAKRIDNDLQNTTPTLLNTFSSKCRNRTYLICFRVQVEHRLAHCRSMYAFDGNANDDGKTD